MMLLREWRAAIKLAVKRKRYLPTVLMYHSVGGNAAHFTVPPESFRRQMAFLKKRGFEVVLLGEIVRRTRNGDSGKLAALTFDDGYKDFIEGALPILKEFHFPATVFLVTGKMGGSYTTSDNVTIPVMSWSDAGDLLRVPGIELGSHTASHAKLDKLSAADVRKELAASREALARQLGVEGPSASLRTGSSTRLGAGGVWLCYPHGRNSDEVRKIAREEGYAGAMTIEPGHPDAKTDPFGIPRQYVHSEMGMKEFEACFV